MTEARQKDCWPTPPQARALGAALRLGSLARPAIEAWAERFTPGQVDPGTLRLLPLVHENAREHGVNTPWDVRLAARRRNASKQVSHSLEAARTTVALLEERGIEALLLKGVPLAVLYYRAPELRPMADIDVLVRVEAVTKALDALRGSRIRRTETGAGASFDALGAHALALADENGRCIDLHWHVFDGCFRSDDDDALWARSRSWTLNGHQVRALSAADQLLHVCVHGHRWIHVPSCRWVADAVTIVRSATTDLDWDVVLREARSRSFTAVLREALPYLCEVTGEPEIVPASVLNELKRARVSWREGTAQRARTIAPELRGGLMSLGLHADSYARFRRSGAIGGGISGWREMARRTWGLTQLRHLPLAILTRGTRRIGQILSWRPSADVRT